MNSFSWSNDIRELHDEVDKILKLKEKERHAEYYKKNRKKILRRQKKADKIRDRKSKEYYEANKERILAANKKRYEDNIEERRLKARQYYHEHKEEIRRRRKDAYKRGKAESVIGEHKELELGCIS